MATEVLSPTRGAGSEDFIEEVTGDSFHPHRHEGGAFSRMFKMGYYNPDPNKSDPYADGVDSDG